MRKLTNKLRSRAGESFAEVLVALLIVAMAALLLAGMYSASSALDKNAMESDKKLYEAVSKLETTDPAATETPSTITITEETTPGGGTGTTVPPIEVNVYTEDGLTAYQKKG